MAKQNIKIPDIKLLSMNSGGKCALPDCKSDLRTRDAVTLKSFPIGEMAHIKGDQPSSARYDSTQTNDERNNFENLLYVCPTCHTKIDKQPVGYYTVEILQGIKRDHEGRVKKFVELATINITFAELDELVTGISLPTALPTTSNYNIILPKDKMEKNGLTKSVEPWLIMGQAKFSEVQNFIQYKSDENPDFAMRLRAGFLEEYYKKFNVGKRGDELFSDLVEYVTAKDLYNPNRFAAGIAVLVYLFTICDIFES